MAIKPQRLSDSDGNPKRARRCSSWRWWLGAGLVLSIASLLLLRTTRTSESSAAAARFMEELRIQLSSVEYVHVPDPTVCRVEVLALVHSAPDHFLHRRVIRGTWASVDQVEDVRLRAVFVLGRVSQQDVQASIDAEAARHKDVIQLDFHDSYRNLTLKHLLAFRWLLQRCGDSNAILIKADDDAFVDPFQLVGYTRRVFGAGVPQGSILCNTLPAGTAVQRAGRWAVDPLHFPARQYPSFCAGLLYVTSRSCAAAMYDAAVTSSNLPALWVDDVFVTGFLAERASVTRFSMNLRYSFEPDPLHKWLINPRNGIFDFIVTHLDTNLPNWSAKIDKIWLKTIVANKRTIS